MDFASPRWLRPPTRADTRDGPRDRSRFSVALRDPAIWLTLGFGALYALTLFPGVGGVVNRGDSAKFQFIGRVVGVSHPPGNPLYLLADALWVRVPLPFRVATRVNLLSSVFALGTLLFLYRTLARAVDRRAGVLGAIALGAGSLFWTLATEAEVYTLNTFLLAGAVHYAARFSEDGDERWFLAGSFFVALGFANHLTMAMLLPAFAWIAIARVRRGSTVRLRSLLVVAAFALASASLYLYVPWRLRAGTVYSEFEGPLDARSFWAYVTAKKFQESFGHLSLVAAVRERMPAIAQFAQKQWPWPMLLALPSAMGALRARAPFLFAPLLLGALGLLAFALGYDIPDPEGFYMPVVLLLAIGLGAGWSKLVATRGAIAWAAFAMLVTVPAAAHVQAWSKRSGFDVVEDMGNETGVVLWDLDDLFAHVPAGALFAVPCRHYGCVEVLNYYRFAEPVVRDRRIEFVRFPNVDGAYWDGPAKIEVIGYERAQSAIVCSIRKPDATAMRERGIALDEIFRPSHDVREGTKQGVVIYCSRPSG